jgi:ABC-type polysaccharide/polyol phosphate export permease
MFMQDLFDVVSGLKKFPVAFWLATEDMRTRYTRTALGPWWNVLSTVTFVGAMGFTFGALFGQPLETYLPYIAASMACWNFMNSIIIDAPGTLVRGAGIVVAYPLPLSTQVFRSVFDKFLLLLHFLVVYVALAFIMRVPVNVVALLMFPVALAVYAVAGTGISLGLCVLGARFRDLGPAISSVMTMVFLLTPVFWQKITLKPEQHWITDLNPFFHMLEIGRQSLLGKFAAPEHWVASITIALFCLVMGIITFAVMRRKIYYWL